MANVSDDLVWSLVRSNTSFLYKRNGRTKRSGKVVLSAEPNNLMNKNSFKFSGLANSKVVGIQFDKDAKGRPCAAMCLKVQREKLCVGPTSFENVLEKDAAPKCFISSSKNLKKPKKSVGKSLLKKTFPSVSQAIKKQTAGTCYRPDLEHTALVRWSKVHLALRVKKGEKKPMAISMGRKNLKAA